MIIRYVLSCIVLVAIVGCSYQYPIGTETDRNTGEITDIYRTVNIWNKREWSFSEYVYWNNKEPIDAK